MLAARINDDFPKRLADRVPHGVDYEVRRLYFDTAHASKFSRARCVERYRASLADSLWKRCPASQISAHRRGARSVRRILTGRLEGHQPRKLKRLFPRLKA